MSETLGQAGGNEGVRIRSTEGCAQRVDCLSFEKSWCFRKDWLQGVAMGGRPKWRWES